MDIWWVVRKYPMSTAMLGLYFPFFGVEGRLFIAFSQVLKGTRGDKEPFRVLSRGGRSDKKSPVAGPWAS